MGALARTTATIIIALGVVVVAGGCPAPRQRDKDQQTGMAPADATGACTPAWEPSSRSRA